MKKVGPGWRGVTELIYSSNIRKLINCIYYWTMYGFCFVFNNYKNNNKE